MKIEIGDMFAIYKYNECVFMKCFYLRVVLNCWNCSCADISHVKASLVLSIRFLRPVPNPENLLTFSWSGLCDNSFRQYPVGLSFGFCFTCSLNLYYRNEELQSEPISKSHWERNGRLEYRSSFVLRLHVCLDFCCVSKTSVSANITFIFLDVPLP